MAHKPRQQSREDEPTGVVPDKPGIMPRQPVIIDRTSLAANGHRLLKLMTNYDLVDQEIRRLLDGAAPPDIEPLPERDEDDELVAV